MLVSILLAIAPIIFVCILMFGAKKSVNFSGIAGWILACVIAVAFFSTTVGDALLISVVGVLNSLGIGIMVVTSMLQITIMQKAGAIKRISVFLKTLAPESQAVQILMICVAAGTALVAIGATPVSILPPIMVALGFQPVAAVLLAITGYISFCSYGLLGIPVNLLSNFSGISLPEAAQLLNIYIPFTTLVVCIGMLWVAGKGKLVKEGLVPSIITSVLMGGAALAIAFVPALNGMISLTGIFAGVAAILGLIVYLKAKGQKIIDTAVLTAEEQTIAKENSLMRALSPWIILVVLLLATSMITPIKAFLNVTLAMPVTVTGQNIASTVSLKCFGQAYFWVLVSTFLAIPFMKPAKGVVAESTKLWAKRFVKPFISNTIFFCIAYIMMMSGGSSIYEGGLNMVGVLAAGSSILFGMAYPIIASPLGLFSGFITGSGASGLAMLASYHMATSASLGISGAAINAASVTASGLASCFALVKIQNATATIDQMGIENKVVKVALPIGILSTVVTAIICAVVIFA